MLGIIFNFRKRNFDPSLCNHCRCIFSPGRMMHIQLIHDVFTYHITPHTMRTNRLNFLSSIMVWGPRPYKWWHHNLLLLLRWGRILLRVPPVKSYQALRQRKKTVDGLKRRKKFSSSCSMITKTSFAIKHTIRQNGNLLQLNYTRDAGENTFRATRQRNNVKLKWAISQKNTRQPKTTPYHWLWKRGRWKRGRWGGWQGSRRRSWACV